MINTFGMKIGITISTIMMSVSHVSANEDAFPPKSVDLILTHAQVKTPEGWTEAMAIRDGVIVALGSHTMVIALRGEKTEVIDLEGQTVLPGFHDMHVHPLVGGVNERRCKVLQGSTLQETQAKVKSCVQGVPTGKWIIGGQWDVSALGQVPDRGMLDVVSATHPILLRDTSGHSAWANTLALKRAGITKDSKDIESGIIERDASGNPTGILREGAINLVQKHIPLPTEKDLKAGLIWAIKNMLSYGITAYNEASLGMIAGIKKEAKLYSELADEGLIKQHTRLCMYWSPKDMDVEEVIVARNLYGRERLALDCIKIFLDGVPTDSQTAAMMEDYQGVKKGTGDAASSKGMLLIDQGKLNEAVIRFDNMGLTVKFHAAGDAAVHVGLNAIAAARSVNGFSGQRHSVGHCTFIAKADLDRARMLGATFEMSPYLWTPSPINDDITSAVGEPRINRAWPVRDALEAGALVVPGSDWAVVPSVNPWIAVEALVTREKSGGSKKSFGKGQTITLTQALDLFTVNSAKHMGRSDQVGSIEVGMLADVIVVEKNPFKVPVTELHKMKVKMTFINGEKLFESKM